MRVAGLTALALAAAVGTSQAQIPDLPTLGENWTDIGYPKLFYTLRDGFTVGLYYAQIRPPGYDDWFDPPPYRASLAIDGQISTSGSRMAGLQARLPNIVPGWRFTLGLRTERWARQNYFGIGNNTAYYGDSVNNAQPHYYRADYHRLWVRGEIQRRVVRGLRLLAGFHAERWRLDTLSGPSLLALHTRDGLDPTLGASTPDVSARFGLVFDTRDDEIAPLKGLLLEAIVGLADSTVAGDLSYTRATFSASGYWSPNEFWTLAGRVLGQVLDMDAPPRIGAYYLIEASDKPLQGVGGFQSHRGLFRNRLLGEDKLLANLEVRHQVLGERHVIAVSLLGFLDIGRVFQPGEDDFRLTLDGMHVGAGFGPVMSISRTGVLGMTMGLGPDGLTVHALTDWAF